MLRLAIVENEIRDTRKLENYLERYEKERSVKFSVTRFQDGEDIVSGYTADYDLILMDIEMRFLNGMKAAQEIRKADSQVLLIFVTNAQQYALQGYRVNALDYLVKPVSWEDFSESLDRAMDRIGDSRKEYITILQKGGKRRLETDRIFYVEVRDHQLIYHTRDGVFSVRAKMKDAAQELNPKKFCLCNRCYLVNLAYVEGMEAENLIVHGERLQISRGRRKSLLTALNEYVNGARS